MGNLTGEAKKKLEFFKNSRKNAFKTLPVGISLNCDWQQEHWCNRCTGTSATPEEVNVIV